MASATTRKEAAEVEPDERSPMERLSDLAGRVVKVPKAEVNAAEKRYKRRRRARKRATT